jgi:hypothetical protein
MMMIFYPFHQNQKEMILKLISWTELPGPSLPNRAKIVKNRAHKGKKRPKPGKYTFIKEKNRAKTRAKKSSKPGICPETG